MQRVRARKLRVVSELVRLEVGGRGVACSRRDNRKHGGAGSGRFCVGRPTGVVKVLSVCVTGGGTGTLDNLVVMWLILWPQRSSGPQTLQQPG